MAALADTDGKAVVCYGECLIDFLGGRNADGSLAPFTPYPGGAPANVAVAVARLGGRAAFLGQVGTDMFGDFLADALARYGVDTSPLARHAAAPTSLAFVSLDASGERSFSFRRDGSADLAITASDIDRLWPAQSAFFHHCSNMLTDVAIADVSAHAVARAKAAGALVSFDANLRPALWLDGKVDRACVDTFARSADIVKLAREELEFLAEGSADAYLDSLLSSGVSLVFITDGAAPARVKSRTHDFEVPCPEVAAVDTTGAGDAFCGGLLYALSRLGHLPEDRETLQGITTFAAACGAHAVTRQGAFPAMPCFTNVAAWPFD
ncbi:carbohydrate kinase family protein [Gimibacter soli]|uniref:Carbohydrate kinase n=1 Tax=Gimibacter soli TaxID=3024400 RepID=A0AAE9XW49_9PROT|nr:carbohydrate kinase [Gimibacter soli]WCL55323.1 carbohydrate kinase [Gimibacter soli]